MKIHVYARKAGGDSGRAAISAKESKRLIGRNLLQGECFRLQIKVGRRTVPMTFEVYATGELTSAEWGRHFPHLDTKRNGGTKIIQAELTEEITAPEQAGFSIVGLLQLATARISESGLIIRIPLIR